MTDVGYYVDLYPVQQITAINCGKFSNKFDQIRPIGTVLSSLLGVPLNAFRNGDVSLWSVVVMVVMVPSQNCVCVCGCVCVCVSVHVWMVAILD